MKITFTKDLVLKQANVYLKINKKVERKDIQNYLQGKKYDNPLIDGRINAYLKEINIYDEYGSLTSRGEFVKNTGKLDEYEEGKYQIWYVENDMVLGNKILFFKRLQPYNDDNRRVNELNLSIKRLNHLLLPTTENKFIEFNIVKNQDYFNGEFLSNKDKISFEWIWDGIKSSDFRFSGNLKTGKDKNIQIKNQLIPCQSDLEEFLSKMIKQWDEKEKMFKISFSSLDDEEKVDFVKDFEIDYNEYEITIEAAPLMAENKDDAEKWQNYLLEKAAEKEYLDIHDFRVISYEIAQKDGLKMYKLPTKSIEQFIIKSNSNLVKQHLQAPMDLNPTNEQKHLAVEIASGSDISFTEIAEKLGFNKKYSKIIYYDKYVINHIQQIKTKSFLDCFKSDEKIVITEIKDISSDYLQRNNEIQVKDYKRVFSQKSPHNRYLIFIDNQDNKTVWVMPHSIDFINFERDERIMPFLQGYVRETMTFTPVNFNEIDKELKKYCENAN